MGTAGRRTGAAVIRSQNETNADGPGIERQLFDEAPGFDFFQAVRLLRLLAHQRGQPAGLLGDVVRFRTNPSLEFPASAVYELTSPERDSGPATMVVNFLGLHGASGVLPRHYTELIGRLERERRDPERTALRDILDRFGHRFIALFYEAWEKYRFWLAAERGTWTSEEPDTFTLCLLSLIGLGSGGMRNRFQVRHRTAEGRLRVLAETCDLALLRYAGLLAQRKRNVHGLERILCDFSGHRVRVLQFQGRWLALSDECRTRLGEGRNACALGESAVLGDRVWDVESKVRIRIGPLDYSQFLALLPDASPAPKGKAVFLLGQLAQFYLGPNLDWDLQLLLKGGEVPPCQLTQDAPGPHLGWNTWLAPGPRGGDAEDAVFTAEECSWPTYGTPHESYPPATGSQHTPLSWQGDRQGYLQHVA